MSVLCSAEFKPDTRFTVHVIHDQCSNLISIRLVFGCWLLISSTPEALYLAKMDNLLDQKVWGITSGLGHWPSHISATMDYLKLFRDWELNREAEERAAFERWVDEKLAEIEEEEREEAKTTAAARRPDAKREKIEMPKEKKEKKATKIETGKEKREKAAAKKKEQKEMRRELVKQKKKSKHN